MSANVQRRASETRKHAAQFEARDNSAESFVHQQLCCDGDCECPQILYEQRLVYWMGDMEIIGDLKVSNVRFS